MLMLPPPLPPMATPDPSTETSISPPVILTSAKPPMPAASPFPIAVTLPSVMLTLPPLPSLLPMATVA